jgi:tRNA(Ile)-lysidine synthetase-like protein
VARELRAAAHQVPDLFTPGARLVVACSGGQDSTTLLHALSRRRPKLDLLAVHVDHALRAESALDAQRVGSLVAELGLAVEVVRVDVAAYRRQLGGSSIQQAARAARYHALAQVASAQQAQAVLVAHTADDQAEALLLHLLRGAGLLGLAGMRLDQWFDPGRLGPVPAEWTAPGGACRLVRPLLGVLRSTTLAYCREAGLKVVEDASNQSRTYARNRVRLDLLPVLEGFNPAVRTVLARTAELAAEDGAALDAMVAVVGEQIGRPLADPAVRSYDLAGWRQQPRAVQRRLLRQALHELLGTLVDVRAAPIDDALDVVNAAQGASRYHLPYGVELVVDEGSIDVRRHGAALPRQRAHKSWGPEVPRV